MITLLVGNMQLLDKTIVFTLSPRSLKNVETVGQLFNSCV
jgi:hypothetical protein